MKRWRAAGLVALLCLPSGIAVAPLAAQQPAPSLLPGNGAALTMAKCSICHDITHVTRSRLTRDEWDDNIKVMIARGMPIEPQEIPIILDYLAAYYNRDKPPPAPDPAAQKGASEAASIEHLLADNGCVACHAIDRKIVGPSFREVSARYKGDGAAAPRLAVKVREGGAGAWGPVPMSPNTMISDADLKRVVEWVLQQ